MALLASRAIQCRHQRLQITWIIDASNEALAAELEAAGVVFDRVDLDPEFSAFRNPLASARKIARLSVMMKSLRPNLVLLVQGSIWSGFDGLAAARLAGVRVASYIPITRRSRRSPARTFDWLRDVAFWSFFRNQSRYITIDDSQAAHINRMHPGAQVKIVENFLRCTATAGPRTPGFKGRAGIPPNLILIGVIGRISFIQKAQDWLVKALRDDAFLADKAIVFVGEGPDSGKLAELIRDSRWQDHIFQLGWNDNVDEIYGALDVLLIPSRLEGVPLVMLEALTRRIPVVGSDCDGMRSWLPSEWRFPFGDADAMKRAIDFALKPLGPEYWNPIEHHLTVVLDEDRFALQFGDALASYCARES